MMLGIHIKILLKTQNLQQMENIKKQLRKEVKLPIRHSLNRQLHTIHGEKYTMPSMTTPDMGMSPKEILQRYATGRPLTKNRFMNATGDAYTPEVRKLDFTEMEELQARNAAYIKELEKQRDERYARHLEQKRNATAAGKDAKDGTDAKDDKAA